MKVSSVCLLLVLVALLGGCSTAMKLDPPNPPTGVTLTPSSAQAIDFRQSISLSASIANDTSNKGVAWALNGVGSLSEETPTSVIYNAPASGNAGTATVTATSAADSTKSASVTINVMSPLTVTTTSLPAGTQGTVYNQAVETSGGAGAVTLTVSSGSLSTGLSMDSSGRITGTPTGPSGTSTAMSAIFPRAAGITSHIEWSPWASRSEIPPWFSTPSRPSSAEWRSWPLVSRRWSSSCWQCSSSPVS